jgi:hypothetical protein
MSPSTQVFVLRAFALLLAGALLLTDRLVPSELWAVVAGSFALSLKRPGDSSHEDVARLLEASDPTPKA